MIKEPNVIEAILQQKIGLFNLALHCFSPLRISLLQ